MWCLVGRFQHRVSAQPPKLQESWVVEEYICFSKQQDISKMWEYSNCRYASGSYAVWARPGCVLWEMHKVINNSVRQIKYLTWTYNFAADQREHLL